MNKLNEQQQIPLLSQNGDIGGVSINKDNNEDQQLIRTRINELEQELNHLRIQLSQSDTD